MNCRDNLGKTQNDRVAIIGKFKPVQWRRLPALHEAAVAEFFKGQFRTRHHLHPSASRVDVAASKNKKNTTRNDDGRLIKHDKE